MFGGPPKKKVEKEIANYSEKVIPILANGAYVSRDFDIWCFYYNEQFLKISQKRVVIRTVTLSIYSQYQLCSQNL